jgi:signal transduction histidine kinase
VQLIAVGCPPLGMGLGIRHAIIEAHDGRLLVENDPAGAFRAHLRTDQPKTT